jgi:hypothetical protein
MGAAMHPKHSERRSMASGMHRVAGLLAQEIPMRVRSWPWCWFLLSFLFACGSKQTPQAQASASAPPPPPAQTSTSAAMCPMMPPAGTQTVVTDTADGVAITFTTSGDVAALRAHVQRMAAMHEHMTTVHEDGGMHGGTMGSGQGGGMHGGMRGSGGSGDIHGGMMGSGGMREMQMIPAHATVEEIPGGARLVLTPNDPAQLTALRDHVRQHVAMMQRGQCPMMQARPAQPTDEHAPHHPAGA